MAEGEKKGGNALVVIIVILLLAGLAYLLFSGAFSGLIPSFAGTTTAPEEPVYPASPSRKIIYDYSPSLPVDTGGSSPPVEEEELPGSC
ncbi:MAG: hypothetical protein V1735_05660 [Nanoarchaeota archaeon]